MRKPIVFAAAAAATLGLVPTGATPAQAAGPAITAVAARTVTIAPGVQVVLTGEAVGVGTGGGHAFEGSCQATVLAALAVNYRVSVWCDVNSTRLAGVPFSLYTPAFSAAASELPATTSASTYQLCVYTNVISSTNQVYFPGPACGTFLP